MIERHLLTPDQRRSEDIAAAASQERQDIISRLDKIHAQPLLSTEALANRLDAAVGRLDAIISCLAAPRPRLRGFWEWLLYHSK